MFLRHRILYLAAGAFVIVFLAGILFFDYNDTPKAEASAADNIAGFAWSENIGWISFNCASTSCEGSNYGVNLDFGTGNLSGYAWSENIGWVSFNAADVAGCPAGTCQPRYNSGTGEFLGWARALANGGGWDGWISLNCANSNACAESNYKVSKTGGNFTGFAWSGDVIGWIKFNPAFGGVSLLNTPPAIVGIPAVSAPSIAQLCGATPPDYNFSWVYNDSGAQSRYELEIDNNSDFSSRTVYKNILSSSSSQLVSLVSSPDSPGSNLLSYQSTTYYWRVKVYDDLGADSGWKDGASFTTPVHMYPTSDFTFTPSNPQINKNITFTDASEAFGGSLIIQRDWDFCDGLGSCPAGGKTASGTPVIKKYTSAQIYNVKLTVADSTPAAQGGPYICSTIKQVNAGAAVNPSWQEVIPE